MKIKLVANSFAEMLRDEFPEAEEGHRFPWNRRNLQKAI